MHCPSLPLEILDIIFYFLLYSDGISPLDHAYSKLSSGTKLARRSIRDCARVCKLWLPPARNWMFRTHFRHGHVRMQCIPHEITNMVHVLCSPLSTLGVGFIKGLSIWICDDTEIDDSKKLLLFTGSEFEPFLGTLQDVNRDVFPALDTLVFHNFEAHIRSRWNTGKEQGAYGTEESSFAPVQETSLLAKIQYLSIKCPPEMEATAFISEYICELFPSLKKLTIFGRGYHCLGMGSYHDLYEPPETLRELDFRYDDLLYILAWLIARRYSKITSICIQGLPVSRFFNHKDPNHHLSNDVSAHLVELQLSIRPSRKWHYDPNKSKELPNLPDASTLVNRFGDKSSARRLSITIQLHMALALLPKVLQRNDILPSLEIIEIFVYDIHQDLITAIDSLLMLDLDFQKSRPLLRELRIKCSSKEIEEEDFELLKDGLKRALSCCQGQMIAVVGELVDIRSPVREISEGISALDHGYSSRSQQTRLALQSMRNCALVCKGWLPVTRNWLLRTHFRQGLVKVLRNPHEIATIVDVLCSPLSTLGTSFVKGLAVSFPSDFGDDYTYRWMKDSKFESFFEALEDVDGVLFPSFQALVFQKPDAYLRGEYAVEESNKIRVNEGTQKTSLVTKIAYLSINCSPGVGAVAYISSTLWRFPSLLKLTLRGTGMDWSDPKIPHDFYRPPETLQKLDIRYDDLSHLHMWLGLCDHSQITSVSIQGFQYSHFFHMQHEVQQFFKHVGARLVELQLSINPVVGRVNHLARKAFTFPEKLDALVNPFSSNTSIKRLSMSIQLDMAFALVPILLQRSDFLPSLELLEIVIFDVVQSHVLAINTLFRFDDELTKSRPTFRELTIKCYRGDIGLGDWEALTDGAQRALNRCQGSAIRLVGALVDAPPPVRVILDERQRIMCYIQRLASSTSGARVAQDARIVESETRLDDKHLYEILDEVLFFLQHSAGVYDKYSLSPETKLVQGYIRDCALVCKSWVPVARSWLFRSQFPDGHVRLQRSTSEISTMINLLHSPLSTLGASFVKGIIVVSATDFPSASKNRRSGYSRLATFLDALEGVDGRFLPALDTFAFKRPVGYLHDDVSIAEDNPSITYCIRDPPFDLTASDERTSLLGQVKHCSIPSLHQISVAEVSRLLLRFPSLEHLVLRGFLSHTPSLQLDCPPKSLHRLGLLPENIPEVSRWLVSHQHARVTSINIAYWAKPRGNSTDDRYEEGAYEPLERRHVIYCWKIIYLRLTCRTLSHSDQYNFVNPFHKNPSVKRLAITTPLGAALVLLPLIFHENNFAEALEELELTIYDEISQAQIHGIDALSKVDYHLQSRRSFHHFVLRGIRGIKSQISAEEWNQLVDAFRKSLRQCQLNGLIVTKTIEVVSWLVYHYGCSYD
ncbi:hypothetical protein NP233_g4570 [Leucocoprinus birnbaumii]|uniref:Uncharacterized protein n=1 Tax=Leucocoprinus birnbaumii TaxID=56174 RepID=A0AAD5VVT8_9AGAR|nr:hypothetical protein NP233_g4570 [Leucocoprinus birnbaumii]